MSDRYETPSWDSEPSELGESRPPGDDEPPAAPELDDAPDGGSLEAATENVFDGWPVAPAEADAADEEPQAEDEPVEPGDDPDAAHAAEAQPAESWEDAAAPPPDEIAPPLADHLSDSSEHAPGELSVPPGYSVLEGMPVGERRAVGLVVSRFNGDVTSRMLESALGELERSGVARERITVMPVPGAFELPLAAMALAKTRRFACIVAIGCVIRGDTPHFEYVSSEAASGLQLAAIETGVPVAFGVLTLERADQADQRVAKGAEAVQTALEMADLFSNLRAAAAQ
jgi:6,7-dimethyl-8-ribityllumazine synthase